MLNVDSASVYTDFNGLAKLKQGAREQSPEAIKEVAKQFESVFLGMMMKNMRQAKLAEGILDSQQTQFYQDMYDQQMSVHLAGKPGFGFADLIAQQLSPKQNKDEEQDKQLSTGDFLNRAAGTGASSNPDKHQSLRAGSEEAEEQMPLDASGLSSLERSLARLERSQNALADQWQTLDDKVNSDSDRPLTSRDEFVNQLRPHAEQAARSLGVDPNVLLAQAALETGWGQGMVKNPQGDNSFNLFNIKADRSWQGKQAKTMTLEYAGGVAKKEMAGFRAYDSYKESFDDYVNFIKTNPRYSEALKKAGNAGHYLHELQQAGYATDPRYAEKVMTIYQSQTAAQVAALKSAG
ncbi:flagellar assembly peptidoglycan hydrolase FlgJ [Methylomonas fluvii]|uniref:Peptidoglycan hydrolase FlgJ n=1 Tax=Methylomonas fluvii TaxID=1854564 RepID=A0ABR9DBJ1_9GAMM|nr:flagellar assembly peptidoglycan hydrolase FlgJ [Methylomonas fluvii]MBD9360477.1 flagellar assembly peptidoglycan hydrolase FlgJ [Methylomonas fluvii]CAD6873296.1 Flagellar protein FlgJ [peptidoglycan hydrolase] [Methylomonas fluvii]